MRVVVTYPWSREGPGVTLVGVDAAITARHHVAVHDDGAAAPARFSVEPTLAGLHTLTDRLVGDGLGSFSSSRR